jgi:hypothetical protein
MHGTSMTIDVVDTAQNAPLMFAEPQSGTGLKIEP